jgi:NAD(P)H dehydrogenase (quinone)
MLVLVIYCHPDKTSFTSSLHLTVLESLREVGHTVIDLDLHGESFRPVMTLEE